MNLIELKSAFEGLSLDKMTTIVSKHGVGKTSLLRAFISHLSTIESETIVVIDGYNESYGRMTSGVAKENADRVIYEYESSATLARIDDVVSYIELLIKSGTKPTTVVIDSVDAFLSYSSHPRDSSIAELVYASKVYGFKLVVTSSLSTRSFELSSPRDVLLSISSRSLYEMSPTILMVTKDGTEEPDQLNVICVKSQISYGRNAVIHMPTFLSKYKLLVQ